MNGSDYDYLFDTNAFILWSNSKRFTAKQRFRKSRAAISLISVGELILGCRISARAEENLRDLRKRLLDFEILYPSGATAENYASIGLQLRRKGRPIPDNDMWIGAAALEHSLKIVTRDSHFREIDGLEVVSLDETPFG